MLSAAVALACMAFAFRRADVRRTDASRSARAFYEALSEAQSIEVRWHRPEDFQTTTERRRRELGAIVDHLPPVGGTREERIDRLLRMSRDGHFDWRFVRSVSCARCGLLRAILTTEGFLALLRMRKRVELPAPTARLLT